ncbi:MAG: AI-2E family transporter [Prevotella sp.]|nr:AI-2E family transporter [Prevotella sp.]
MTKETITFDRFIRWAGIALIVLAVFFLIRSLSSVLLPFFIAWFFAYLLYPMVKFFDRRLHLPRALSILLALFIVVAVLSGIIYLIIPPMIEQFEKLGTLATDYIHKSANIDDIPTAISGWISDNHAEIEAFFKSSDFTEGLKTVMPGLFTFLGQTYSVIVSVIASFITLLYMFFILLDYEYLTDNWIKIFPKKNRPFWQELAFDAEREMNNYIRGQGLVALCMGVLFCIGFTIIDFPMAIGLGIMIGLMDLVPYLHTLALIPTVLLALLKSADTGQNFWFILIMALAVFLIVQLICDMIVTPKVMGKAMGLNPAILLLSLSVWGALLGFIGLIIALPLTTLLIAYYQRYVTKEDEIEAEDDTSAD